MFLLAMKAVTKFFYLLNLGTCDSFVTVDREQSEDVVKKELRETLKEEINKQSNPSKTNNQLLSHLRHDKSINLGVNQKSC